MALVVGVPPGNPGGSQVVSGGVPFPNGTLEDASSVRVVDEDGKEVASQAESTQWWAPDRRLIRWLLLTFRAEPKRAYSVEFGSEVRRSHASALATAERSADGTVSSVKVDTGALRFVLDHNLRVKAEAHLGGQWLPCADGALGLSMKLLNRDSLEVLIARAENPDGVTLARLPRTGWRFRLDPENVGEKQGWSEPNQDDSGWSPDELTGVSLALLRILLTFQPPSPARRARRGREMWAKSRTSPGKPGGGTNWPRRGESEMAAASAPPGLRANSARELLSRSSGPALWFTRSVSSRRQQ